MSLFNNYEQSCALYTEYTPIFSVHACMMKEDSVVKRKNVFYMIRYYFRFTRIIALGLVGISKLHINCTCGQIISLAVYTFPLDSVLAYALES